MILPALLLALEWNRSRRAGRSQPMTFSADRMMVCVELDHHFLRHVEFLQLPQEEHPLLGLLDGGGDVLRPPQVLCNYSPQESERLHSVNWGVAHGEGDRLGWAPPKVCYHPYSFQSASDGSGCTRKPGCQLPLCRQPRPHWRLIQ